MASCGSAVAFKVIPGETQSGNITAVDYNTGKIKMGRSRRQNQ